MLCTFILSSVVKCMDIFPKSMQCSRRDENFPSLGEEENRDLQRLANTDSSILLGQVINQARLMLRYNLNIVMVILICIPSIS